MNILYIHGFSSSSKSSTPKYFKKKLKDTIYSFDIPTSPEQAILFIDKKIKELNIDIIIGTSLGGVYAYHFDLPKIVINPAFQLNLNEGNYTFLNERTNGETEFNITKNDVNYFNELVESFKNKEVKEKLFYTSYILIGNSDDIVQFDLIDQYTNKYDEIITKDFGHRLTNEIIDNSVFPIIEKLKKTINSINYSEIHE